LIAACLAQPKEVRDEIRMIRAENDAEEYPDDEPLSEEWKAEIKRRLDAYDSGEDKAISPEEFFGTADWQLER